MKNIRHLIISAIALCSLWTPSFCLGEKLRGSRILNLAFGAPSNVAKNPKQSAAYLDSLNEKVEELRTRYQTFMSTDELSSTIRGNQVKTKQQIERKKQWKETTAVYGLRNARLTTEQPELIDAVKLIEDGKTQEEKLRKRSKKLGLKPGLKKVEDKIEEFKGRLKEANIDDTTTSATTGLTIQQIQDKAVLLRKELQEAWNYNRTVATDILGFNLKLIQEGADDLWFSQLSSKDKAWIKKIQEQATSFFDKVKKNAEDKTKLLDESAIRDKYKELWNPSDAGTQPNLNDPEAVYARLASQNGPLQKDLPPEDISLYITTYNEIDFETRLSTAVVDSMAGQCALLKKNQPAQNSLSTDAADAVPPIISSGWLNNVQTYIAGYQDVAVLAGLGIYSARGAVQDIQKQVEAAIAKLNSYLEISTAATNNVDDSGAGDGTSTPSSAKADRKAIVNSVHGAFSNLTADKKKSVKELIQTIETTLRALHNQYQRLLNGNRIIALKAKETTPPSEGRGEEERTEAKTKPKYSNQTTRGTTTTTAARTEFKEAKTKLYDLLAMIQAVRSGSFTPEDKKAIVERQKTLANLFFIMDQKDADEDNEVQATNELDDATDDLASVTIVRDQLEKTRGTETIQGTERAIQQNELKQQRRIRERKLATTATSLNQLTQDIRAVVTEAEAARAPETVIIVLQRVADATSMAERSSDPEQAKIASTTTRDLSTALEELSTASEEQTTTPVQRKRFEGLRTKLISLRDTLMFWRNRTQQPRPVPEADWDISNVRRDTKASSDSDEDSAGGAGMSTPSPASRRPVATRRTLSEGFSEEDGAAEGRSPLPADVNSGDRLRSAFAAQAETESPSRTVDTSAQQIPKEVKEQISLLQRLLRKLSRKKTADALDSMSPPAIIKIAQDIAGRPDLDDSGDIDQNERECANQAKSLLERIKDWIKSIKGGTKTPIGKGYLYELADKTIGSRTEEGDSINFIRTESEITELWYKAPTSFIVKLQNPQPNTYGTTEGQKNYIIMEMIEDKQNDANTITLVPNPRKPRIDSATLTSTGMTPLDIRPAREPGDDYSGAAEGKTRKSVSVNTTDAPSIPIVPDPTRPQTEQEEGIYRLSRALTIELPNRTTKDLITFRIMDGGNNQITNIENIWLIKSNASLTVYTKIKSGYSKNSVGISDIGTNGELMIKVSSRNFHKYQMINNENLVYPEIGSDWQDTAPAKPVARRTSKHPEQIPVSAADASADATSDHSPHSSSEYETEETGVDGMYGARRHLA